MTRFLCHFLSICLITKLDKRDTLLQTLHLKYPTYRTKTQVFNIFMWQYKCISPYTGNGNCQNGVLLITWQSKSKHIRHVVKSVYKMKEQYYYWNHCTKVFGRIWNWHSCVYVSQRVDKNAEIMIAVEPWCVVWIFLQFTSICNQPTNCYATNPSPPPPLTSFPHYLRLEFHQCILSEAWDKFVARGCKGGELSLIKYVCEEVMLTWWYWHISFWSIHWWKSYPFYKKSCYGILLKLSLQFWNTTNGWLLIDVGY